MKHNPTFLSDITVNKLRQKIQEKEHQIDKQLKDMNALKSELIELRNRVKILEIQNESKLQRINELTQNQIQYEALKYQFDEYKHQSADTIQQYQHHIQKLYESMVSKKQQPGSIR